MCDTKFRIGYEVCIREEALDLLLDGVSKAEVAQRMKITWPTADKWLKEYNMAGMEIDALLSRPIYKPARAPQVRTS